MKNKVKKVVKQGNSCEDSEKEINATHGVHLKRKENEIRAVKDKHKKLKTGTKINLN